VRDMYGNEVCNTPTTRLLAERSRKNKVKLESDSMWQLATGADSIRRVELAEYLRMVADAVGDSGRSLFKVEFTITEVEEKK